LVLYNNKKALLKDRETAAKSAKLEAKAKKQTAGDTSGSEGSSSQSSSSLGRLFRFGKNRHMPSLSLRQARHYKMSQAELRARYSF
jgi:hypothetical protein